MLDTVSVETGSLCTVFEVKLVLGQPGARLGVRDRLGAEAVLLVAVIEVVGVLERAAYSKGGIWSVYAIYSQQLMSIII